MTQKSILRLFNIERLLHSVKTVIACMLGLLATKLLGFHTSQWLVITILVVMCAQIYVGSVLQKAYMRFLGTLIGCLFAAFIIAAFGTNDLSTALAIGIAGFVFSYLATGLENYSYAGTLGAVTTTIIMLGQTPTLPFAFERFCEISVGILIASIVSQFVLPVHARTHLRRAQAKTLEQLRDYYAAVLMHVKPLDPDFDIHDLDEELVGSLLKQRQLAKESKREPLAAAFDPKHFMRVLYAEREILRAITLMHTALHQSNIFQGTQAFTEFNTDIVNGLETLSKSIALNTTKKVSIQIPSLQPLKTIIQNNNVASPELNIAMNGFLFSAEILTRSLEEIAKLFGMKI